MRNGTAAAGGDRERIHNLTEGGVYGRVDRHQSGAIVGNTETTMGLVLSTAAPVVNVHGLGTNPPINALPAKSSAALLIVAVYVVSGKSGFNGLNVAIVPA